MADVFVSYARSDKARVAPLVAAIEAEGWSVWWDPSIEPGQEFDQRIVAELESAAAVVVVWTPTSVTSRWVRGEAREAADRGKLVPARFDGASLPLDFRAVHTTDLDRWGEDAKSPAAQELLRALGATIARQHDAPTAAVARSPARTSIAVLPFTNLTGDAGKEYFGDGLAEELINVLVHVAGLTVAARTSSFAYKNRNTDARQIARELQVGTVLEGSVRSAGERIRVTAQLIDGETGFHLWSQNYDRRFEDLFALQDELATAIIVQTLNVTQQGAATVGRLRGPPTRNLEAYQLYLQAMQEIPGLGVGLRSGFDKLQQAIARDPGFAQARLAVVSTRALALFNDVQLPGSIDDAEREALQAVAAAPDSGTTHAALGVIHAARSRWLQAEESFQKALAIDDADPWTQNSYGLHLLGTVGHVRHSLSTALEAHRLAPAWAAGHISLAVAYDVAGLAADARTHADAAIALGVPITAPPMPDLFARLAVRAGRYEQAARLITDALPIEVRSARGIETVEQIYSAMSDPSRRADAINVLDHLRDAVGMDRISNFMRRRLLVWYATLGALDQAYAILSLSLDDFARSGTIGTAWGFLWFAELAAFREDSRFLALANRMNLPEYWQVYGPPDGYDWREGRLVAR